MRLGTWGLHLVGGVFLMIVAAISAGPQTGFLNRTLQTGKGTFRYQVYVPADWTKARKWPVVLFLHGAGERGDDGIVQTEVGIGTAIRKHSDRFPGIVVFPQCRKNFFWSQPEMEEVALKSLDLAIKEFNGDTSRLYLTGISMGGYGSWDVARRYPGKFAAIAPICGGIIPPSVIKDAPKPEVDESGDPYLTVAKRIGKTPVWVFHGGADPVVPTSESRKMVEALKSLGADVKYVEYEGVGHNSWDKAYAEPELAVWLFSHQLKK